MHFRHSISIAAATTRRLTATVLNDVTRLSAKAGGLGLAGWNILARSVRASICGGLLGLIVFCLTQGNSAQGNDLAEDFSRAIEQSIPEEAPYSYHKRLSQDPVHRARRNAAFQPTPDEMALSERGWRLVWNKQSSPALSSAVRDLRDYLEVCMRVEVKLEELQSLDGWETVPQTIVVGTRKLLPGCSAELTHSKDYQLIASPDRLVVCGHDERGAIAGLHNLEARMNLREAPFLPKRLNTVRRSLYQNRMVLSWMGWMEWPDRVLSHLAHDGFDAIFTSVYANPNGDPGPSDSSTELYARLLFRVRRQDPNRIRDLIDRATKHGIKVYAPIIYQYLGSAESEAGLRKLVREILREFPEIRGYVLLTEGFYYKEWAAAHTDNEEVLREWAKNWCRAVGIVAEECHRVDGTIEVLPWEYNIDFRPHKASIKRYFIQQLPQNTIPLVTWENGKSFEVDGLHGHLRDYSLSQVGPAEVTAAQIDEARKRGMKVYSKVDTFASWQFGTIPYLPCPYQWHERYQALEKHGVNGTLESWSSGYTPNFMTEIRAWYCWTDAPPLDELLRALARRDFGVDNEALVLKAWQHFSRAIRLVPDTGPSMGTNNAVGNPLFLEQPPARTMTLNYSWIDQVKWTGYFGAEINPYWPFTVSRMVFYPDFTNRTNMAETYARNASGIQIVDGEAGKDSKVLPTFNKYLLLAADEFAQGLVSYRKAALLSPASKREGAFREVMLAEQMERMLRSDQAILEFEDLRLQLAGQIDDGRAKVVLDRMEDILKQEIDRTKLSLVAARRDSRLGFQFEQDYVYTPYSLQEKLNLLDETLTKHIQVYRRKCSSK